MVFIEGFTIKEASSISGIKYGTAKTIMRVFKMTGRVNRMIKSTNKFTYKLGSDGKIVKEIEEDF